MKIDYSVAGFMKRYCALDDYLGGKYAKLRQSRHLIIACLANLG